MQSTGTSRRSFCSWLLSFCSRLLCKARVRLAPTLTATLVVLAINSAGYTQSAPSQPAQRSAPPSQPAQQPAPPSQPAQQSAPPSQPAQQSSPAASPSRSEEAILVAVRSTLIALDQANVTGNYTVLRDLGAPGFSANNSAADLSRIFANIRQQKLDFTPIALMEPKYSMGPLIDAQNLLRVGGTLAAIPTALKYELAFQLVNDRWRLFGINLQPEAASQPAR